MRRGSARRRFVALVCALSVWTAVVTTGSGAASVVAATPDSNAILKIGVNFLEKATFPFDPALRSGNRSSIPVSEAIYDTLIRRDPVTGAMKPGLALEWTTPDPLTLELKLRQNVQFQDGTPFNAEAVKFSIDREIAAVRARKTVGVDPAALELTATEVVDPSRVRLRLANPVSGYFINELFPFADVMGIVSPTAVAKYGDDFKNHPVGAGPFMFQSYTPEQRLSVRKFANYWDKKSYRYGGIDFIHTRSGTEAVSALRSGVVDSGILDTPSAASLKNVSGFKVLEQTSDAVFILNLPSCVAPFTDPAVRDAISKGINRDEIVAALGAGIPTALPFTSDSKYYDAKAAKANAYNLKQAKALLQGKGPFPPLTILLKNLPSDQQVGTVLKSQLEALGFQINLFTSLDVPNDLVRLKPMFVSLTGLSSVAPYFTPGSSSNAMCGYTNPAPLASWNSALRDQSISEPRRVEAFSQALQTWTDVAPVVWIAAMPFYNGYSTHLKGVTRINVHDQASVVLRTLWKPRAG